MLVVFVLLISTCRSMSFILSTTSQCCQGMVGLTACVRYRLKIAVSYPSPEAWLPSYCCTVFPRLVGHAPIAADHPLRSAKRIRDYALVVGQI